MTQRWITRDGSRRVESILLDGHTTFLVTDPRHRSQPPDAYGYVRVLVHEGRLAPSTVAHLRQLGVNLADLRQEARP